jgi:hypothetical protein
MAQFLLAKFHIPAAGDQGFVSFVANALAVLLNLACQACGHGKTGFHCEVCPLCSAPLRLESGILGECCAQLSASHSS